MKYVMMIVFGFSLAACGGTNSHTCDQSATATKSCVEYEGTQAELMAATACTNSGTVGTSCPSSNRVGRCTYSGENITSTTHYYNGSASALESGCKSISNSTWMEK